MSQKVRMDMLPRLRQRYGGQGREGKSRMIDELCEQFGYSRKHAIKLLNAQVGWGGEPMSDEGGRPSMRLPPWKFCSGFGEWPSNPVANDW
ncbi:MAG: hypothetical protein ACPGVU_25695 [Limisphaerales bacterium]